LVMRRVLLSLCIGALLCAPIVAQDFFVKDWEKTYSTEKQGEMIQHIAVGDLDNDGTLEIVVGLSIRPLAGIQTYAVQILDHRGNKRQRWDSTFPINDVSISDVNDDDVAEILVSGADLHVLSNTAQNLNYPPIGTVVLSALAADMDNDRKKELLVGTRDVICISDTLNWTVSIGTQIKKMLITDLDGDGTPEIVILTRQNVHVLDNNGNKVWVSPGMQNLRDVAVADVDEDRNKEILFSTDNMLILMWEAREDGMQGEIDLGSYAADLLAAEDLDEDGIPEIIVATSKLRLEILDLEGNSLQEYRFEPVGDQDSFADMVVKDMDRDNRVDILLAHSINVRGAASDSLLYFLKNTWRAPPPPKGTEYFNQAVELFDRGEYSTALDVFLQAQAAFAEEGNQEMADECQVYIDQCTTWLTTQTEADSKFSQAEALFNQGDYEEAVTLYEEARTLYEELEDTEKAQACSQRITEIQNMQVPEEEEPVEEPETRGIGLLLVVVVGLLGAAAYVVMKYRKRTRPMEEEKPVEEVEEEITPSDEIREEERKLKAQYVYGEINREEYREKLRKLYES